MSRQIGAWNCASSRINRRNGRVGWRHVGAKKIHHFPPHRTRRAGSLRIGRSVTELEIEFGILSDPDQRRRSFFYFRDPLPYAQMPSDVAATSPMWLELEPANEWPLFAGSPIFIRCLLVVQNISHNVTRFVRSLAIVCLLFVRCDAI